LPAKRKTKTNAQDEQTMLLRMILAELQTLNANLAAANRPAAPAMVESAVDEDPDSDDEELEYFE
jgi:hypothetical protein